MFCAKCGASNSAGGEFCSACGASLTAAAAAAAGPFIATKINTAFEPASRDYSDLKPFYQRAFANMDGVGGKMTTQWNWAAFFFGALWYLFKGMPIKGILFLVLTILTGGLLGFFLAVYAGLYGTWDYYLAKVKGKQFW